MLISSRVSTLGDYRTHAAIHGIDQLPKFPRVWLFPYLFNLLNKLFSSSSRGNAASRFFIIDQIFLTRLRSGEKAGCFATELQGTFQRVTAWREIAVIASRAW